MNQVFKGAEDLPIQFAQADVTGFRIYVHLCRKGRPAQLSVNVKGVSYPSTSHTDKTGLVAP